MTTEVTAENTNAVATTDLVNLDAFRKVAAEGYRPAFAGSLLKFKKGLWFHGADKTEVEDGTTLVALMTEFRIGYQKWKGGKIIDERVAKITDGVAIHREALGDLDERAWPLGLSGHREDPWQHTLFAAFKTIDDAELFVFPTSSDGGKQAVFKLVHEFARQGHKHVGQFPVVAIGTESYEHPTYNTVHKPTLEIVGWTDFEDTPECHLPRIAPPSRTNMDDEIPY